MPLSILNWAVATTVLKRDRPNADPKDITRISLLAALMPGATGLIVPFVMEKTLPEKPSDTPPSTSNILPSGTTSNTDGTASNPNGTASNTTTPLDEVRERLDATDSKLDDVRQHLDTTDTKLDTLDHKLDGQLKDIRNILSTLQP